MTSLLNDLNIISPVTLIKGYLNDFKKLSETELIVVATSSAEVLIHSSNLRENAIIYDMTQPQNIDKKSLQERKDLSIYDGGLIFVHGLKGKLPFGLPRHVIYACLGETILLGLSNMKNDFSLGKVKIEQVEDIKKIARDFNFKPLDLIK